MVLCSPTCRVESAPDGRKISYFIFEKSESCKDDDLAKAEGWVTKQTSKNTTNRNTTMVRINGTLACGCNSDVIISTCRAIGGLIFLSYISSSWSDISRREDVLLNIPLRPTKWVRVDFECGISKSLRILTRRGNIDQIHLPRKPNQKRSSLKFLFFACWHQADFYAPNANRKL